MNKKSTLRSVANDYLTHPNKQNGITLIALVTTIIVLLILAGITIAQITGNDNTMDKAKEAVDKDAITNEKETIELAVVNITSKTNNISEVDENELESELSNSTTSITKNDDYWDLTGNTGTKYKIIDDGSVYTEEELKDIIIQQAQNAGVDMELEDAVLKDGTKARFVTYPTDICLNYNIVKYGILYAKENTSDYNVTNAMDMLLENGIWKVCKSTTGASYRLNVTPIDDQRIWAIGYIIIEKYGMQVTIFSSCGVKSAKVSELQNQNN